MKNVRVSRIAEIVLSRGGGLSHTEANIRLLQSHAGAKLSHVRATTGPPPDVTRCALETHTCPFLQLLNPHFDPNSHLYQSL